MEINNPQITIESLMDQIREGARRRTTADGGTDSNAPPTANSFVAGRDEYSPDFPALTAAEGAPLTLQPDFEPHPDDQYQLHDLVKYHDRNFVQNAYLAILKRGPDATGYTAFIESLRSGRLNKIDVLARLRYSTEGRAKKVQVKGLFMPAAIRQLYRLPLVGYLLRLGIGLARLPSAVRHQQQFEAHVHAQQQQIVDHTNHLAVMLSRHGREVAHVLTQASDSARADNARQQQQHELLNQQIELLKQQGESLKQQHESLKEQHESLKHEQEARQAAFLERLDAVQRQFDILIDKAVSHWQQEMQALAAKHSEQSAQYLAHAERLTQDVRVEVETLGRGLRGEVEGIFQKEQEIRTELSLQSQRVARLLEEAGRRLPAPFAARQLEAFADEQLHLDDAFYLSFEDRFRGRPAEIKERLKVYLPLVEEARTVVGAQVVLDIGCGRGEWLELLRESGVMASGVEQNRVLVAEGQSRGLKMIEADLMAYLRELPDESLMALTGFHIIEHLPLETLLRLLDETVRVVSPGGLVIFETPNPENVLVGSCNFYFDPTHRNPLPAPVMKFLLESRGLTRVQIIRLNPSDAEPVAGDTDLVKRFNQYFYGPMDYAVVGWKGLKQ